MIIGHTNVGVNDLTSMVVMWDAIGGMQLGTPINWMQLGIHQLDGDLMGVLNWKGRFRPLPAGCTHVYIMIR